MGLSLLVECNQRQHHDLEEAMIVAMWDVQTLVLQLVLPKTLRNLVQQDLTERVVQPTIFTIGNLAAKHQEGQDALQQAGKPKSYCRPHLLVPSSISSRQV